ncbi:hypothetical protein KEM56_004960 [Ascosphaera pollenicola]|nr:hypothetical protein KEM56_004960 [Ascosphaera pollenicola]
MAEDAAYRESPLPSEQPLGGEKDDYNNSTSSMDEFLPAAADAEEYTGSPDYYTLLNLPREPAPTDAQIRAAFRTLTLSFHPDKQPPELREAAAHQYDRIRIAYETLSDPHRRVVYDMLGEEGVRAEWGVGGSMGRSGEAERSGMALGVRAMDERQFRKWFLDTMRKRERKALDELVQARGSIKVNFDARSMITTDAEGTPTLQVPDLNLTSYSLGYSFRTPFSPLRWLSGLSSNGEEEPASKSVAPNNLDTEEDEPDDMLEIKAGINGKLHELKKKIRLVNQETDREFDKEVRHPYCHELIFNKANQRFR